MLGYRTMEKMGNQTILPNAPPPYSPAYGINYQRMIDTSQSYAMPEEREISYYRKGKYGEEILRRLKSKKYILIFTGVSVILIVFFITFYRDLIF